MEETVNSTYSPDCYSKNNYTNESDIYYDQEQWVNSTNIRSGYSSLHLAKKVLDLLYLHYMGFIVIFGLVGNANNVFSFIRSKKKLSSPSYYLAALALHDVIFLLTLLILWLKHFSINIFNRVGMYQFIFFLSSTSSCVSGAFLIINSFNRLK